MVAKNDPMVKASLELFADFINEYKLDSTKEIFETETNYKKDENELSKLKLNLKESNGSCIIQKLLNNSIKIK